MLDISSEDRRAQVSAVVELATQTSARVLARITAVRGAALMTGSMTAFVVNDAFMKSVLVTMPVFQATFLRGVGITLCLIILCRLLGQLRFDFGRGDWRLALTTF